MNEDIRRVANRIRDAYTLDEAEQILNNLLDEYYAPIKMPDSNREKLIQVVKQWAADEFNAMVGDDEYLTDGHDAGTANDAQNIRNVLRRKLRKQLAEWEKQ